MLSCRGGAGRPIRANRALLHPILRPLDAALRIIQCSAYHGVLAPGARWRATVVRDRSECPAPTPSTPPRLAALHQDLAPLRERVLCWADLIRRVFELDVLECPRCSGRCAVIAVITDPPGHPALPGLSGPFHTRATHRPCTTGPAAGPPILTRLPRGVLGSDITPLGPRRIRVLVFRAGTAIRRPAGTNTPA